MEVMGPMVDAGLRDGSEDARVRSAHGVSFETWAFVLSGLSDGLALEELLAHLDLDEGRWNAADGAFQEELLDDVERGGERSEALDDAMREAKKSWRRPIPPLDCELGAWLDFYRAWAMTEAPMTFLHKIGLRASDIHRLQALWLDRLADDASLRAKAIAILAAPARPAPTPNPGPPQFIRRSAPQAASADATAPLALRLVGESLPFMAGAAAPMYPPLSVPLPPPRALARRAGMDETSSSPIAGIHPVLPFSAAAPEMPRLDETVIGSPLPPRPVLPFQGSGGEKEAHAVDALIVEETAPMGAQISPIPLPFSRPMGSSPTEPGKSAFVVQISDSIASVFTVERYAAFCIEFVAVLDQREGTLSRYGITSEQKVKLDACWAQKMANDPAVWLAWDRACTAHRVALRGKGSAS
jgi:hypothetical protein